jgi:signal transduction histidine kinase
MGLVTPNSKPSSGVVTRHDAGGALTAFGWAIVIALTMASEFLAQPFVWRNWSAPEVLAGWLRIAGDRLMVACAVAACLVVADRLRPRGRGGRTLALGLAIVVGAMVGEGLRLAADPFAERPELAAVLGRIVEWTLISAVGAGILLTWRRGADLATDAAEASAADARLRRMRTMSELDALQRQIEPHFLFNTLATVKRFSQIAPADGLVLVERLYDYVSASERMSRLSWTTLGAELDLVLAYLDVCSVRMESRLTVTDAVAPDLRNQRVPPLMLGTLVENAVRHGLAPRAGGGALTLAARLVGDRVEIVVADDGEGLKGEGGGGIGLANLTARLALLYGGRASFHLRGIEPHGAEAILRLPRDSTPV